LDAEFRELMCLELRKLHDDIDATTVYVTHDQQEAMSMADRIAVMNEGEILQADSPNIIYNKPKTKFVANFIGSPGMNFMPINQKISPNQNNVSVANTTINIPTQKDGSSSDQNFLGIRPENLKLVSENGIKGNIFGVEYLGSRKILTVETVVGNIKIRVDSDTNVQVNEQVQFNVLNNNQIIFDGSTDKALKSEFIS
jgi:multiple sugar transport system ATP-binding protein